MPTKAPRDGMSDDVIDILHGLIAHVDERFDKVDTKLADVVTRLDRLEFLLSAQERRIEILEDRMRIVATRLGLEFREQ